MQSLCTAELIVSAVSYTHLDVYKRQVLDTLFILYCIVLIRFTYCFMLPSSKYPINKNKKYYSRLYTSNRTILEWFIHFRMFALSIRKLTDTISSSAFTTTYVSDCTSSSPSAIITISSVINKMLE